MAIGEAGPGPATQAAQSQLLGHHLGASCRILKDHDNSQVEEEDESVGKLIQMDNSIQSQWQQACGLSDMSDELMDGTTWVVKENTGHSALDRLLAIPGVVEKLSLSFHNTQALHQKIDTIPPRAGKWKVGRLHFKNQPDAEFILHYRDPLEAIRSLWGDLSLSEHLAY
ncbi:hypothetical protein Moror_7502 [Moniliophthora roreri MCA 2997]|uniref:Uncharacterized protein n=1 Tax=Moniliophthora roreri (strain MCA 2997) TaxID=1381753 RepID=V2WTT2_MONRO|nr:hypothetical protein Moror_7502 [Moniliophthora roreri MCA 2997]